MIHKIPLERALVLQIGPVVWGPKSPGVELRLYSHAGGTPRDTGSYVIVPTLLVEKLTAALAAAAHESMMGSLFAPVAEVER